VAKTVATTPQLEWTGDADADRLISENPTALLIGFSFSVLMPVPSAAPITAIEIFR